MNKFLVILLSIIACLCIGIDVWYLILLNNMPEKAVSQTYEVGAQTVTTIDGDESTKYFCEVNLYDNCFELKFNYLLDENKNAFFSQGIQYVPNSDTGTFNFDGDYSTSVFEEKTDYQEYSEGILMWKVTGFISWYNRVLTDKNYKNLRVFNYSSADDFQNVIDDSNKIDLNTSFKIELGDEIYLMRFNGSKAVKNKDSVEMQEFFINETSNTYYGKNSREQYYDYYSNYRASDISYFSELIFNSIQTLRKGIDQTIVFQFGDLFDYYAFDQTTGTYLETTISSDKYSKIVTDIKSYYAIKVTIHEGDLKSSKQSLFGCFCGAINYETEDFTSAEYFFGKTILNLTEKDFVIENTETGNVLVLSKEFSEKYSKFKDKIYLKVVLSENFMTKNEATINKNSFGDFLIYKVLLSNGEEVKYE